MKKPIKQWLETIADPTIREAAISQIDENSKGWPEDGLVSSLTDALDFFNSWARTKEGVRHWHGIYTKVRNGLIETREVEATKPRKNSIIDTWLDKNVFTFNSSDYTKTEEEDGTIILKPKKKKLKVWIEVYLFEGEMRIWQYNSFKELEQGLTQNNENSTTLLEVIEREYEI